MTAVKREKTKARKLQTVRELIAFHADRLGYKNAELAKKLGYPVPNVISMLKAGSMKLPVNKIAVTAQALEIDPLYLARCVEAESGFGLGELLDAVSRRTPLTLNEEKLIQAMRKATNDIDFDLADSPQAFDEIVRIYAEAAKASASQTEERIRQLKVNKRSALAREAA